VVLLVEFELLINLLDPVRLAELAATRSLVDEVPRIVLTAGHFPTPPPHHTSLQYCFSNPPKKGVNDDVMCEKIFILGE
jgi:hypothetical protein